MEFRTKLIVYFSAAVILLGVLGAGNVPKEREAAQTAAELITGDSPRIVLDPGHGGADGGCVAEDGTPEKGINLSVALGTRDVLTLLGYDVVMTRNSDVSIHDSGVEGLANQKKSDMKNRLALINEAGTVAAVSIHQNQFTDPQYYGAQMFYKADSSESERLAEAIRSQIVPRLQPENQRELKPVGDELYLIHNAACPAVMVECGFLSNPVEAAKLETAEYQQQIAFCTAAGIIDFAGCGE